MTYQEGTARNTWTESPAVMLLDGKGGEFYLRGEGGTDISPNGRALSVLALEITVSKKQMQLLKDFQNKEHFLRADCKDF